MIGTSEGQSYNTKWDQYSEQLFGPVTKNEDQRQEPLKVGSDTQKENKRTSEAPKGSTHPSTEDPRGMLPHIQSEAKRLGMDPNVVIGVAKSEGLRSFKSSVPGENSFGAFQLYTGGGLGNEFQKQTGLDPSDPKNEKEGITFALEHARQHGWGAFHGAKNTGISQWAGIPGEHVDNDHHVPLAASALTDGSGRIAVDHRTQDSDLGLKGFSAFAAVGEHERAELRHMVDLVDTGMDPQEAYKESHDNVANVREKAHVKAEAARLGYEGDPEEFYQKYQDFWKEAALKAKEPTDRPIHPAAHTTKYKLDPKSGRFKVAMDYTHDDEDRHPPLQLDVLGSKLVQGPGKLFYRKPANENTNVKELPIDSSVRAFNRGKELTPKQQKLLKIDEAFGLSNVDRSISGRMQDRDVEADIKARFISKGFSAEDYKYYRALHKQLFEKGDKNAPLFPKEE